MAEVKGNKHLCPKCGEYFTDQEVSDLNRQIAIRILGAHGISARSIGKLFNMHPTSVKYWSKKK